MGPVNPPLIGVRLLLGIRLKAYSSLIYIDPKRGDYIHLKMILPACV